MAANYKVLDHGIVCIDTEQVRPGLAACFLMGQGSSYALVETGTSLSVPQVLEVMAALDVPRSAVEYVMPTHVHLDHAGGAGALMEQLPNARLVVHPRGARHMIDPSRLIAGATAVYGEQAMQQMYGRIVPVPEERVIVAQVSAGQDFRLDLGTRPLRLIDAPGHARHHYVIWDETSRGWFTGDSFGSSYRDFDWEGGVYLVPSTTPVDFDPPAWEQTLQHLMQVQPECMYLTHYGRVGDPQTLVQDLRSSLAAYQRMALTLAGQPDFDQRLRAELMQFHLDELHARHHPMPDERVRQLLAVDVEINAQGLSVWLARQEKGSHPAAGQ